MDTHAIPDHLMREFTELLVERMGLYFPQDRWAELAKKLVPVMKALGAETMIACIEELTTALIQGKPVHELVYHLTIGETYFFRDTRAWEKMEAHIISDLIKRHERDRTLRIWSAGCCTGEEPYSLAMLLQRTVPQIQDWTITLLASDINRTFLNKAEQARYSKWSFRATPPEMVRCYFEKQKNELFHLIPEVRRMVTFKHWNLIDASDAERLDAMRDLDLIMCNNVLIYFSQQQIQNTINRFADSLTPHGWLQVTPIEVPYVKHERLNPYNYGGSVFFRCEPKRSHESLFPTTHTKAKLPKAPARLIAPETAPSSKVAQARTVATPANQLISYEECLELYRQKKYDNACDKLVGVLDPLRKNGDALNRHFREVLLLIRTLANIGQLALALEWCQIALNANKLNPVLQYLQAEILVSQNKLPEAIKTLRTAVFLDADFAAAHYLLGVLEEREQHPQVAARQYKVALALVEQYEPDAILPGTDELTAAHVKEYLAGVLHK